MSQKSSITIATRKVPTAITYMSGCRNQRSVTLGRNPEFHPVREIKLGSVGL